MLAAASWLLVVDQMPWMLPPALRKRAADANATNAISKVYSIRSCPWSSFQKLRRAFTSVTNPFEKWASHSAKSYHRIMTAVVYRSLDTLVMRSWARIPQTVKILTDRISSAALPRLSYCDPRHACGALQKYSRALKRFSQYTLSGTVPKDLLPPE